MMWQRHLGDFYVECSDTFILMCIASFLTDSSNTAELYEGITACKERKYTSGKILLTLMHSKFFY